MKIGIIVEPYEEKNASGIALCILNQTKHFLMLDKDNEYLIYTSSPFKKERLSANAKNILIPRSFFGKNLWFLKNAYFNKILIPDILIFNMPLLPLILPERVKTVPIFYEVVSEFGSGVREKILNIFWGFLAGFALKRAPLIITPSYASKDDLCGFYKINPDKVKTIHLGFQNPDEFKGIALDSEKNHVPYFLFIGKAKFKKNIHGIVNGFIKFKKKFNTNHKLIFIGSYGGKYYEEILKNLRASSLEEEVIFKGYIYDDFYAVFKNAESLVFPSFREGFGMPIIEAMYLGVPVITSNVSSMPEVAGGAALLVDPRNPEEIAEAMAKIAFDRGLREDLISRGIERAKQFSWQDHASQFLKYLELRN
ncbi:MAG: hypothetical protein A2909_00070 [Candidatus Tagabacteria bacterium RIFCSPLOWO2_01_FULL_39_11]|uniref:Glycosyl transferase family 1 domain-containing protein n=1 Tax=Candidatus Tagabacteria bacterium RIFCSPLOWO2_01_FULL_39_11 TaxID=1802295 RepID=A0A1G2LV16_9BACT|nr:MAG: hypothetical protein A2909_00070 [Candidatus Tagabacteria bacterium RIFCSPLOWO2_01_FULL_39_11]